MKQAKNSGAGICQRCLKHWKQVHPSKRLIKPVEKAACDKAAEVAIETMTGSSKME